MTGWRLLIGRKHYPLWTRHSASEHCEERVFAIFHDWSHLTVRTTGSIVTKRRPNCVIQSLGKKETLQRSASSFYMGTCST